VSVNGPFIPESVPTVVVAFVNLRYMRVALVSAGCAVMVPDGVGPVIPTAVTVVAAFEAATYCPSRRPAIGALAP
jgi:hypothetical protein